MTGLRPSPRGRLFHLFFAAFYQAEQAEAFTASAVKTFVWLRDILAS
jgi:hypothetical protein